MGVPGGGLVGAAPEGPGDDGGRFDWAVRKARGNPADFLHRPALMVWTPPDGIDVPRWWC